MSEEDRKALIDSDPAAFDVETKEKKDEDKVAQPAADPDADPEGKEPTADGVEGGDTAGGDDKQDDPDKTAAEANDKEGKGERVDQQVPRSQLNGVVRERNEYKELSRRQAAELEQLRQRMGEHKAPRDFEGEFNKILADYDAGQIDDREKDVALRKLNQEEARFISQQESLKSQHETKTEDANLTWKADMTAFADRNPGFLSNDENVETFQRALAAVVAYRGGNISNDQLISEAAEMAFRDTGYTPPTSANGAGKQNAAAQKRIEDRRRENAQATAAAADTPPRNAGGTGTRAAAAPAADLSTMKAGNFSKQFTRAQQEEMLGGSGSL